MVGRVEVERFRVANAELSRLVKDALESFFRSLDLNEPESARDALLEFVPILVEEYGEVAATIAADWYDELRLASGAAGAFRAVAAPLAIPAAAIEARVRYFAKHLWTPTPESMLGPLLTATDKYVKQPGRDTIRRNAQREGARYARVPQGSKTCAFCLVLASRDAVYYSRQSAGDVLGEGVGDDFHGDCDCAVVRIGRGDEYPGDYLPGDYERMYEVATERAANDPEVLEFLDTLDPTDKNFRLKGVAYAMRREFPGAVKDSAHPH